MGKSSSGFFEQSYAVPSAEWSHGFAADLFQLYQLDNQIKIAMKIRMTHYAMFMEKCNAGNGALPRWKQ
jgi:hypothetical protein